jgi:outer membrane protein assembly factor BamD (BamD/ComL family)
LGAVFLFNPRTKLYHYDGQAWEEILKRYPNSSEVKEAKQRVESLKQKMSATN